MDTRTLDALRASIRRWQHKLHVVEQATVRGHSVACWSTVNPHGEDGSLTSFISLSIDSCALCDLYYPRNLSFPPGPANTHCDGCPVKTHSGRRYCEGTPYYRVYDAVDGEVCNDEPPTLIVHIQDELDFLRSLLPEAEGATP